MISKTQILRLEHNHNSDMQQSLYCPFTGKQIISQNPEEEISESELPDSVLAIWTPETAAWDEAYYVSDDFDFKIELFSEIEDIEGCANLIDTLKKNEQYLFIEYSSYGNIPGDYGQLVYLLKIPNSY